MKRKNLKRRLTALALALAPLSVAAGADIPAPAARHPEVEIVFVLDTTGSMGGLIEGAKRKIWAVANEIAKGRPTPKIKMGIVAYRDRGDDYVTRIFDLSSNLDRIYKDLLSLQASGGGDGPEHVLKALSDAVERVSWSADPKAFKVVYLVGDAPPHAEYKDTPALEAILQAAVKKGLLVNAIQCGSDGETAEVWQRVARLGEGRYFAIAQDGGMAAVATPYDGRLSALSRRLDATVLGWGSRRDAAREARSLAAAVGSAAPAVAMAERAVFKSRGGFDEETDLAAAVAQGRVRLSAVPAADLPEELKGLSPLQREARVRGILEERRKIKAEMDALAAKRERFVAREAAKSARPGSFDARLMESIKAQASRAGITY